MKIRLLGIFIFLFTIHIFAQPKKVELITAGSLEGTTYNNQPVRKLTNNVVFKQDDALLYCDLAYQFTLKNELEAFSNIRIIRGDSQSIVNGEHMNYFGDARLAKITGRNIILTNKTMKLYTTILDYNLALDISNYYNIGKVIDGVNTLTSNMGTYFKQSNNFLFIKNVVFKDGKYTIYSDTLNYNTETQIIDFRGPSTIIGPNGTMKSDKGFYNSITKQTDFQGRAQIVYDNFILNADKIKYNQFTHYGFAEGNVVMVSPKDSVTVFGDFGEYWGLKGHTKVYPRALMQTVSGGGKDTMFLSADTLLSINDTIKKQKQLHAFHKVIVYDRKNMQAICDSMVNNLIDSTTTFYKDPVLWNGKNQMRGDTVIAILKNKKLNQVRFRLKAFMISQDTLENFNQVKGKNMVAYFDSSRINRIEVKENAESIYYALQEDTATNGLNKIESADLSVKFKKQKLKTISFYKKPKATFVPVQDITDNIIRLKGFKWRNSERPNLAAVMGKYYFIEPKKKPLKDSTVKAIKQKLYPKKKIKK